MRAGDVTSSDITFNENVMLFSGKESVVCSTGTGDQEDASRNVEIEVEIGTAQGGAAENSSR